MEERSPEPTKKKTVEDYILGDVLGEGAYGAVLYAKEKASGREVAIKVLDKAHIVKENKVKYVTTERDILSACNHPNIVKLFCTFTDQDHLYFVLELASNGELLTQIRKHGNFDFNVAVYYSAEIVCTLHYLHNTVGVIHRDLKPENILLSDQWHIKLTDFGTAKMVGEGRESRAVSFVGTAEYISPELLVDKYCIKSSDLWALGCVVYQMLTGRPPFRGLSEFLTFEKVIKGEIAYPKNFPPVARDLISKLLVKDPTKRLGYNDFDEIKSHPFFAGIDWKAMPSTSPPPIVPSSQKPIWEDEVLKEEQERKSLKREKGRKEWAKFLEPNEQILESGLVFKRRRLSIKKRFLILTDKPRIIYIDPKKKILKGEVPWSSKLTVEVQSSTNWRILTPKRVYVLQDVRGDPKKWADAINGKLKEEEDHNN